MTSIQSASLSPYLAILEDEISTDLRVTIDPKDLRTEVRKVLLQEVLRQGAVAMSELSNTLAWKNSDSELQRAEVKLGRHLGYINELLQMRASQRIDPDHQLNAGAQS